MITATLSLPYGAHARQRVDVAVPDDAGGSLLCCIGGGWWADGRCEAGRGFALAAAERGLAVASLGHRPLGDGARTGDEVLADLADAAIKAFEEAAVLGFGGRSIVLLGHASGSLAAFDLQQRLARRAQVRGIIACGVLATLTHDAGTAAAHVAACDRFAMGRHKDLSPLHREAIGLPPVLLLHGEADREIPASQAQSLHDRLAAAGETVQLAVLPGAGHRFAEDALGTHLRPALDRIAAFLAEHAREPAGDFSFGSGQGR